jgi:putative NADH-flavin reductase
MRIAVLGATGRTGKLVIDQAIERGHVVRPITRRADAARDQTWAVADGSDVPAIQAAVRGCDAVAFAIGPSGRGADPRVLSQSLAATLAAMPGAGVNRIVVVTADGPFKDSGDPLIRFVAKPILGAVLPQSMADFRAAERLLHNSTVDWTIIRPAQLTDKASRGYRSRRGASLWFGFRTSRAATAAAVLDALEDKGSIGATVAVAN